jgi:hypothetical protein
VNAPVPTDYDADGFPLYRVESPPLWPEFDLGPVFGRFERVGRFRVTFVPNPPLPRLKNDPTGIAYRAAFASPAESVEMVRCGERPATVFSVDKSYESRKIYQQRRSALLEAKEQGLAVAGYVIAFVPGDSRRDWGREDRPESRRYYVAGRDEAAVQRLIAANNLTLPEHDIAFGRALGYSEVDIRRYCEHSIALHQSSLPEEEKAQIVAAAFANAGPRLEELTTAPAVASIPTLSGLESAWDR